MEFWDDVRTCLLSAGCWIVLGCMFCGCATENQLGFQPFGNAKIDGKADIGDEMKDSTKVQGSTVNSGTLVQMAKDNLGEIVLAFIAVVFAILWLYGRFDRFQDALKEAEREAATLAGENRILKQNAGK